MALLVLSKPPEKPAPNVEALCAEARLAVEALYELAKSCGLTVEPAEFGPSSGPGRFVESVRKLHKYGYRGELDLAPSLHAIRSIATVTLSFRAYESANQTPSTNDDKEILHLEHALYTAYARNKVDRANELTENSYSEIAKIFSDSAPQHISFFELALIANMSEMAVRNATRSQSKDHLSTVETSRKTYVATKDACHWLADRNGFSPTQPSVEDNDTVLVPFAKDGTYFPKNCLRGGRYRIGPKGDEATYENKYEALERLRKMDKARWRRPNENGIPGIVTAKEWKPVLRTDFEQH